MKVNPVNYYVNPSFVGPPPKMPVVTTGALKPAAGPTNLFYDSSQAGMGSERSFFRLMPLMVGMLMLVIKTLIESLNKGEDKKGLDGDGKPSASKPAQDDRIGKNEENKVPPRNGKEAAQEQKGEPKNPSPSPEKPSPGYSQSIVDQVGGSADSVTGGPGVKLNPNSNLPAINPGQWTPRNGSNGGPFATPFSQNNVETTGNSISTKLKGGEGAEAQFNSTIGTGFYQFDVNPQASSQKGDITTVFLYSGVGTNGTKQQGFELDAEYNLVAPGTVTFGTWIDGVKYNEVTVPAPKGEQTIGFNIQNGQTQIGYVEPDGTFVPVSETKDSRITPQLASNLKPMTNSWRIEGTPDTGQTSSITVNGFGRSDAPGQPAKAVA